MKPLTKVVGWLARKQIDEERDARIFWEEVAHERWRSARDAQAAAAEMLNGIDLGQAHIQVTRSLNAPTHVSITYGDRVVLYGDVIQPLERLT